MADTGIVPRDTDTWRALITEYGQLTKLTGHSPQSRGQRFNGLIAELLECWDISARANKRSKGEIDVGFTLEGVRYVLEAKWEKTKADTGDLAKLHKRVQQRLSGTHGVFLAMAGYTPEAVADLGDGQRLELLLLDRTHWEAMLSGLVPPQELLSLARDHAAFQGDAYAPLHKLLASQARPSSVDFNASAQRPGTDNAGSAQSRPVLSVRNSNQLGLYCIAPDSLLLTTARGIVRADLTSRTVSPAIDVAHCHRNPLVLGDGSILFTRCFGVGRFHNGRISVAAGGAVGATSLTPGTDDTAWFLDNGSESTPASISRIATELTDQARYGLDYPAAMATNAAWITPEQLVIIGGAGMAVTTLSDRSASHRALTQANPMGLLRRDENTVLTTGDNLTVAVTHLHTGQPLEVAVVPELRGSVSELAQSANGDIYVAAYDMSADNYTVMQLNTAAPQTPPLLNVATPTATASGSTHPTAPIRARPTQRDAPHTLTSGGQTATPPFNEVAAALVISRREERERGHSDGFAFAPALGWPCLEHLAARGFRLDFWLESLRNGWHDVLVGRAPDGATTAAWLPELADRLGTYLDPVGQERWSFTPSSDYVEGFADGLRSVYDSVRHANGKTPDEAPASVFLAVKGILGSINFDGSAVTIRKEGYGPRMKGVKRLPVNEIQQVIVKPATAMFHGYIQFVVQDQPPAPDVRLSLAAGRPHREDPYSISFSRRANSDIERLKQHVNSAITSYH